MRKLLGIVLSVLMMLSSFGSFVYAEDAELAATDWTQMILTVKENTLANETKNYSSVDTMWDPQTEYHYKHYVSFQGSNEDGNIDYGGGSTVFYIGNWSIGTIPSAELGGKFYVGMLVRTNSASKPMYNPLNVTGTGSKQVTASNAFVGNGEWEFNSIDFELPTTLTSFTHGHLKFGTESGKYIDVAAWGLFATSVSKAAAEAALKNASKVSEADIVTTSLADAEGNITNPHYVGTITLPVLEDNGDAIFAGWTDTKDSYNVIANGGTSYTPTTNVILYPVYTKKVRFVDGSASTNGTGLTADSPYNTFAQAAADLNNIGGTIVVIGKTTNFSLKNSADIVITSVYEGVDYRENGAELNYASTNYIQFGYVENPGKVTMENLKVVCPTSDGWHLFGHDTVIKDSVSVYDTAGNTHNTVQLLGFVSSNTPVLPDTFDRETKITIDNNNNTTLIFGAREAITSGGFDVTVNGKISSLQISNNTYNKYWSANDSKVDVGFGSLTIDGNVKVTVNGTITGDISARTAYRDVEDYYYSLNEITGDLAVIVNHGGQFNGNITTPVKERVKGKWMQITGIEGATLLR